MADAIVSKPTTNNPPPVKTIGNSLTVFLFDFKYFVLFLPNPNKPEEIINIIQFHRLIGYKRQYLRMVSHFSVNVNPYTGKML